MESKHLGVEELEVLHRDLIEACDTLFRNANGIGLLAHARNYAAVEESVSEARNALQVIVCNSSILQRNKA